MEVQQRHLHPSSSILIRNYSTNSILLGVFILNLGMSLITKMWLWSFSWTFKTCTVDLEVKGWVVSQHPNHGKQSSKTQVFRGVWGSLESPETVPGGFTRSKPFYSRVKMLFAFHCHSRVFQSLCYLPLALWHPLVIQQSNSVLTLTLRVGMDIIGEGLSPTWLSTSDTSLKWGARVTDFYRADCRFGSSHNLPGPNW